MIGLTALPPYAIVFSRDYPLCKRGTLHQQQGATDAKIHRGDSEAVVPYVPWPDDGCTLAEARARTADRVLWKEWRDRVDGFKQLDPPIGYSRGYSMDDVEHDHESRRRLKSRMNEAQRKLELEFRQLLESKQLLAYGRLRSLEAKPQLIGSDIWPALTEFGFGNSAAAEGRRGGSYFLAIRVYPVLLAPDRVDHLAGRTLSEAFQSYVVRDPEVSALAGEALRAAPRFERVLVRGRCHVDGTDEWPVTFEGYDLVGTVHPDAEKRSPIGYFRDPDPESVIAATEALTFRYSCLMEALRRGDVVAEGVPVASTHSARIPRSIWFHNDFYLNAQSGDVYEVNQACEDPPQDWLLKRWVGVMLDRPRSSFAEADKASAEALPTGTAPNDPVDKIAYPRPFTVDDVVRAASLSEALEHLVFNHPEVKGLQPAAIAAAASEGCVFDETVGLVGSVAGLDEPVIPIRHVSHQRRRNREAEEFAARKAELESNEFDRPYPPALDAYYRAINRRVGLLFQFLQERELVGLGHASDGHLVPLAHTIWSHEDFYVHRYDGDIYEAGPEILEKKWTGVTLAAPSALSSSGSFHVKPIEPDGPSSSTPDYGSLPKKVPLATARVQTRTTSYKACVDWLEQIMRSSPNERTRTRDDLWREAQERWPNTLSKRSFLAGRDEAIRNTGAVVWGAAGASRKSQRQNRRTE